MPRVISGTAGRLQLVTPAGLKTRPTTDKTKEAIFNILQVRLNFTGLEVLDLFAGSGQLAIECLSRGAKRAVLVDKSRSARIAQEENLQRTKLSSKATIWALAADLALKKMLAAKMRFDLIFIDPPYADLADFWQNKAATVAELLNPGGILVVEGDFATELSQFVTCLQPFKHCHYGSTMVIFYMRD